MFTSIKLAAEPYLIWIKVAAIALIFLSGCYVTHLYYAKQLSDAVIARQKAELELKDKMANIEVKFIKEVAIIEKKGAERVRHEIEYVPVLTPSTSCVACSTSTITEGFIEYHNAAADGRDVRPMTTEEIAKLSAKTLQDATLIIDKNYTQCNKYILQINSLQELLLEIQKVHNK